MAGYIVVRKAVLAKSPHCKFSIVLNGGDFLTTNAKSLTNLLRDYKNKTQLYPDFKIDAIHFEHWNQAYANETALANYATQFIHDMGMIVGKPSRDVSGQRVTHRLSIRDQVGTRMEVPSPL